MKNSSLLGVAIAAAMAVTSMGAQTSPPTIVGTWRADAPLPNGVVQTFRFDPDGQFDLSSALAVDGTYRVDGNVLVETVALPSVGVTHTDSATFKISGDSLLVDERAGAPARVLHRSGTPMPASGIVGDWAILVGSGTEAHYAFAADGSMHVRAKVGDEQGKYTVRADTLHLSNDQTFQLPATAHFAVADSVLTLTPLNGKAARQFHKVSAQ
jgi:uncharacterized protein DUF5640